MYKIISINLDNVRFIEHWIAVLTSNVQKG